MKITFIIEDSQGKEVKIEMPLNSEIVLALSGKEITLSNIIQ
jgi:hypothetical protein